MSYRTSVAIVPYYINEIRRKQDAVVYKMSHAPKLWELLCLIMFRWKRMFPWNPYACLYLPVCTYICFFDVYAAYIGLHVFISAICTYSAHLNLHLATCANICWYMCSDRTMLYIYSDVMVGDYVLSAGRATDSGSGLHRWLPPDWWRPPAVTGGDYSVWRVLLTRADVFLMYDKVVVYSCLEIAI